MLEVALEMNATAITGRPYSCKERRHVCFFVMSMFNCTDIGGKCGMLLKNLAYLGILATILADALSTSGKVFLVAAVQVFVVLFCLVLLTIFPRYLQIYFDVSVVNSNFATGMFLASVLTFVTSTVEEWDVSNARPCLQRHVCNVTAFIEEVLAGFSVLESF